MVKSEKRMESREEIEMLEMVNDEKQ